MYVCGAVFSAEVPDLQTLVNAMKGPLGLTEAIVDLGAGWLRTIAGPESCRTLTVLWHEPCALAQAPQPADAGTSPASQAQPGSVSIEAITGLADLPCTWTGTAHASTHYYTTIIGSVYDEVGSIDGTFTFGNPQVDPSGSFVTYEITSGSATWHASGDIGSVGGYVCHFSKGGTEAIRGELGVSDDGSGQLTYGGLGAISHQATGCELAITYTSTVFDTCLVAWPVTGLDLSGSCIDSNDASVDHNEVDSLYHNEFTWHLTGVSCSVAAAAVTPQAPVCGGAAASLAESPPAAQPSLTP